MIGRPLFQQREDLARLRRGGTVELVLDGGVDLAAERVRLDAFVDGEQAAKLIAFVGIIGLERHGRILPVAIADEQAFRIADPQRVDVLVGAQPHQDGGKQRLRVAACRRGSRASIRRRDWAARSRAS